MKNSASRILKHVTSVLKSIAKAKSMAIKGKTDTMTARVIMFSMLKNKKFSLGSISHKIHALLQGQHKNADQECQEWENSRASVLYNSTNGGSSSEPVEMKPAEDGDGGYGYYGDEEEDDDRYPDLTHSLFDPEDDGVDLGDPNGSVIDLVRNSKEEEGENFNLEDEIDHVADLFIMKFHTKMRLQKLESFKRYQEMLQRSA